MLRRSSRTTEVPHLYLLLPLLIASPFLQSARKKNHENEYLTRNKPDWRILVVTKIEQNKIKL